MSTENDNAIIKVNKWDGPAVKYVLDDVVKNIITKKYNYIENFDLLDGRLTICGTAVLVAVIVFVFDYLYPFPASRPVLTVGASTYFALMVASAYYAMYIEKGIFLVVVQRAASFDPVYSSEAWSFFLNIMIYLFSLVQFPYSFQLEVSSYLKMYDAQYTLVLSTKNYVTGVVNKTSVTKSVANFIDVNGVVIPELVEAMLSEMAAPLQLVLRSPVEPM